MGRVKMLISIDEKTKEKIEWLKQRYPFISKSGIIEQAFWIAFNQILIRLELMKKEVGNNGGIPIYKHKVAQENSSENR